MKKILAILLTLCVLFALTSCELIRKIEPADTAKPDENESVNEENESYDTDFPETDEGAADSDDELRYTEDEAYSLLSGSLSSDEEDSSAVIERTGDIIAQSNGTEYYIFNVTLPVPEESDTEAGDTADSGEETEEIPEGPVPYYVSTNGIVYTSLEEDNATAENAGGTYLIKHGETDSETGYAYRIEYQGLVKNQSIYCYNFIVYLEDTSSGETQSVYKTNYLVSLDGKSSGEQVMEQDNSPS